MEARLGRVATPAVVVGAQVFWGFEENKDEIADLLGVQVTADGSGGSTDAPTEGDTASGIGAPGSRGGEVA